VIPNYKEIHNKFRLNGISYNQEGLKEVAYSFVKEGESFEQSVGNFLLNWLDDTDTVSVNTSGSTGTPKTISLKKQAMVYSAIATGNYFKLKAGNTALHCLSTDFIAGKMMLVRAMIIGLQIDLVTPSSHPLGNSKNQYDFCAMVPMQVENSLSELNRISTLIVGGAAASNTLIEKLQDLKTNVYATYGMTETITHIAIKQLNLSTVISSTSTSLSTGAIEKSHFEILPNIKISQDQRNCLIIEAPQLFEGKIITNDIIKLHSDTTFEFFGRFDNVINSGGVKLCPEQIEAKLSKLIKERFFIASETDETLGQKVILLIEGTNKSFPKSVFQTLSKYEKPKAIYTISNFVETSSGKINRQKTLKSLKL